MNDPQAKEEIAQAAKAVAEELNADVILYNGTLHRAGAGLLINQTAALRGRANVLLLLVTDGGYPDDAYRIARWLQRRYQHLILYVSGYCKSAGTLLAVGAHKLVMSDRGELGPLDVQMPKKDEPSESQSVLDVQATLLELQGYAQETLVSTVSEINLGIEGPVPLQMAMEIAADITIGLFAPLYGQIDPIDIGVAARARDIAYQYGERLLAVGENIAIEQLDRIVSDYPSHGFVIDREEAGELFCRVRKPKENESDLADLLGDDALYPTDQDDTALPLVRVLSEKSADVATKNDAFPTKGGDDAPTTHDAQRAPEEVDQDED